MWVILNDIEDLFGFPDDIDGFTLLLEETQSIRLIVPSSIHLDVS